ncbi:OmpA family protein [Cardiobacteriaceae bacterium TAE3-ERU3]|nr:OmpA family protein [Cardiobacteriaceae bacterium TAE3-ERU3]
MKMKIAAIGLAMIALGGCSTLTSVDSAGQPEGELVWPEVGRAITLDNDRGTYGDMNRISLIRSGATRDDIYQLIGRPQFGEGFRVREWDYVFYFHNKDGAEQTCQYKILFDNNLIAREFYWKPAFEDADYSCPPQQNVTLSADALFRFDGGSMADLLSKGRAELEMLANTLTDKSIQSVNIYGYTDRLGSDAYNQKLSQQRAETVKAYLVNHGVNASLISAVGKGEADPVKVCSDQGSRDELIACLQPNRRVEVEINR